MQQAIDTAKKDSVSASQLQLNKIEQTGCIPYKEILKQNKYFNFADKATAPLIQVKNHEHKEEAFYLLAFIVLFFALIRAMFFKYVQNLFTIMFRATLKQKQLREQLAQTPLPSFLLNIFFVMVAATFASFLFRYYGLFENVNFWLIVLYSAVVISVIYLLKFLGLKFIGWVFNLKSTINSYIFIVFLINKLLAVFLVPLMILIAFQAEKAAVWITVSYILISIALIYRYLASYGPIRNEIKVKQVHFFLYLCAFEIAPLLLIYKVLLNFFEKTV